MRSVLIVLPLLVVVLLASSACTVDESCDSHDEDRCEGAVAVTCHVPTSNGYGQFARYSVERVRCTSGVCGRSCECFKECDICERSLIATVACDPDPASCEQTCRGL